MGRTFRFDAKEGHSIRDGEIHSRYYRKELKPARVRRARDVRHDTRQAIKNGETENLPDYVGTCGWISH